MFLISKILLFQASILDFGFVRVTKNITTKLFYERFMRSIVLQNSTFFFSFFLSIDFASCYFRCYCTFKCVGNRKGSREVISFCNARWVLVASFRGNGFHVHVFFIHAKNRGWCEWLIFWFEQNLKKKKKIVTISLFCFTELRDIQRNLTKSKCLKYT